MNEYTDQNLKDFEAALKNKDLSGLNLYSGSNHSNNFCNLNVEEVVTGVAKQIMALQSSDCLLNKKPVQRLNPSIKYPKNAEYSCLSLSNKICKQDKFDTQNVSDTQLINLVQNAEALDDITGLTQVFNTTFCNNTSDSHFEKVIDSSENSNSIIRQSQLPIDNKCIFDKHDSIHEKSLEQEATDDLNCDEFGLLEEAGRSPILNIIKPISIKRRPTPIAYDLNLFEKFETLAFPIVEEHLDLKVAKKIINSQLLDKKLYIETHSEPVLIERDKSPVFDVKRKKRCRNKNNCNNQFDSNISIIDDEILFSSDEELDKKNDDDKLPLTCLLETSYFTEKVLDETIYVGFQTANNKTIRVKTDSYFKAHDMLKDSDISFINTEEKLTDESIETEDINLSEKKIKQKKCCSFISSNNLVESSKNSTIAKENTVCGSQHTIEIKYEQELDLPLSTKPTSADTIESITKIYPNRNSIDSVENKVQKLNPNQVKIVNNDLFTIDDIIHHEKVVPQSQTLICSSSLEMARNENSVSLSSKKDDLGKLTNTFKIKNNYSEFHPSGTNVNALDCNFVVTNKRKHDMSPKTKNLKKKIKPQNDICEPVNSCYSKTHPKMEKKCNEIYFDDFESSDIIKYENYKAESIKNIHCVTFKLFENSMDEEPYHKANIPTDSKKATSISESTDIYDCDDLFSNEMTLVKSEFHHMPFNGFKTASNKTIQISKEALKKSTRLLDDIYIDIHSTHNEKQTYELENSNPSNKHLCRGEIKDKKEIKTSNVTFANPSKLFSDSDEESELSFPLTPPKSNVFKGVQTTSRKDIKISKEALTETAKTFDNIYKESIGILENKESNVICPAPKFRFQTANNKPVDISEDAIIASQTLLNSGKHKNSNEFKGFQTASRKDIKISKKALAKSTLLNFEKPRISNEFKGFQTANKKEIKISKDALARTAKLFDNIDENNPIKENQEFLNLDKQKMQYHTASNKPVEISDELLGVSQCLLNNIKSKLHLKEQNVQRMFQTANNKEVKMSKEALTKTNNIFDRLNFKTDTNKNKAISIVLSQGENCNESDDIKNILDTQVMLNFGETLNTEDFINDRTSHSKRSGSPILSCSKSKKRKFENTYNNEKDKNKIKSIDIKSSDEKFNFDACYKKNKIYNLSTLKDLEKQFLRKGNNTDLSKLNFNTLLQFVFTGNRNELSKKEVSIDHIKDIFLKSVNKKIVPKGWLENHIQLIMWKLFSYEVRFPNCLDKVCSVRNVLDQLKYRYDRELYNVQRPSLRKILEKDDVSSKTLVLCIAEIYVDNKIIKGTFHQSVSRYSAIRRVLPIGTRVSDTTASRPFCPNCHLSNRTEGKCRNCALTSRVFILRFMWKSLRMAALDSENMDSWDGDSCKLESGSQIAWMMRTNKDPAEFRANLTESQIRLLQDYTSKNRERQIDMIQEKVRERVRNSGLCAARNVVPLMKIRVACIENEKKVTKGMLSIWCPSDLIEEVIREGSWIDVYNVVPTAIRYSEIQLSANRQTIFKKSTSKNTISNKITGQLSRQCYLIKDLKNPNLITDYNEVDTVGLVFLIEPTNIAFPTSKALYQNIFLADENKNIICINFWGGLKKFGYENVLDTGQIIACVNLQKRSGNIIKNIPQYRATEFSYFTKTPKYECSRKLLNDLVKIFSGLDKRKFCDDCCRIKENNSKLNNSSNISPYRMNNSDYNISKNRAYIESPLVQKDSNLNLTGLDFDSTFKLRDSQELSPNELLRKKRVDEKIAKLKILGDPPPLSSINLINKSIKAGNAFRSPLTSKNEGANVASDKNSDEKENIKSPVLFVNRTYIVRPSVNPVRLNFSTEEANRSDVDPFAEEFDASPPLSFD
ncbi:unnamed protein product [Leptidea sinapis]|uniref:Tower domain-containing protein n=1 Tax=Leptidea sinapis TaxID=189913 RepID=A0A5E4QK10_9NEOP|nr:unnamed protein product [Leptidea sinapis]